MIDKVQKASNAEVPNAEYIITFFSAKSVEIATASDTHRFIITRAKTIISDLKGTLI
jgi:hypothetical protein